MIINKIFSRPPGLGLNQRSISYTRFGLGFGFLAVAVVGSFYFFPSDPTGSSASGSAEFHPQEVDRVSMLDREPSSRAENPNPNAPHSQLMALVKKEDLLQVKPLLEDVTFELGRDEKLAIQQWYFKAKDHQQDLRGTLIYGLSRSFSGEGWEERFFKRMILEEARSKPMDGVISFYPLRLFLAYFEDHFPDTPNVRDSMKRILSAVIDSDSFPNDVHLKAKTLLNR